MCSHKHIIGARYKSRNFDDGLNWIIIKWNEFYQNCLRLLVFQTLPL